MRQINFIILTRLSALIVLNHLHEYFNILGHLSYQAVEKHLNVQLGVPTSFDRLLICQEHINKTLGWLQIPFANQRLSYGTSRCFDAFTGKIRPQDIYPQCH